MESDDGSGSLEWVYGDFQSDQLREKRAQVEAKKFGRELEPLATTSKKLNVANVNPAELGVSREYKKGLRVLPDYPDSDLSDDPNDGPRDFDPDLYQEYREMIGRLKESEFYEAYNAGKPTLTTKDLTWDYLFKELEAIYGALDPGPGCPSTGPMAGMLAEYKQFRVEQMERWLENIQKYGDNIFTADHYESEEMAPKRPEGIRKLIASRFKYEELASFDMNPATNPSGYDHYLLPRPKLDPSCLRLVESEEHANESGSIECSSSSPTQSEYLWDGSECGEDVIESSDEDEEEPLFYRELTTLGLFDPKMCTVGFNLIPNLCGQMLAERIQECLLQYPLGVHFSKFGRVLEESLGYTPTFQTDYGSLEQMVKTEKDIFWTQHEPEFPPVGAPHLRQEILFPAHFAGMYADLLTIMNRVWRKYRCMVVLLAPLLPLTEKGWTKFQQFIAQSDTQVGFHYSDWGFPSHEAFVLFCLRKWRNEGFYILKAGTIVIGRPGTVSEASIFYGRGEIIPPREVAERRAVSQGIPIDCTLDASRLFRFTDCIRPGDVHLIGGGEYVTPHLFGAVEINHWEIFEDRFKDNLKRCYNYMSKGRRETYARYVVDPNRLRPGHIVIAFCTDEWDRAIIIKRISEDHFLIYLVDWGSFGVSNYKKLHYMLKKFLKFPAVGMACKLVQKTEEADPFFTEERRWDMKTSVKFSNLMFRHLVELKFLEVNTLSGQPIWTVEARQLIEKSNHDQIYDIPDLNRRTFNVAPPFGRKFKPQLNCADRRLLKFKKSRVDLFGKLEIGPLGEHNAWEECEAEKPALLPTISPYVEFHIMDDPNRKPVVGKEPAGDLSDFDSDEEGAMKYVDTNEEESEFKEREVLLAPRRELDPMTKPMPVNAETKLQAMKDSYLLASFKSRKYLLNQKIFEQE